MKRALIAITILASLSACSHTRYYSVRCLTREQLDKLKADEPPKVAPKLTGKADTDVKIVAGSAIRLRAYSHGLLGVLGGCVG